MSLRNNNMASTLLAKNWDHTQGMDGKSR